MSDYPWWFWGLLGRVALSLFLAKPTDAPPAAERVLLVGDSLAVGLAPPLRASLGTRFASDARGGTVARQWITRGWLAAALAQHKPTLVLVSSGTNDAAGQITAEAFAANVRDVTALAAQHGARVVWLAPPPMPYATAQIPAGLAASGVPTLTPPADLERAPDKIHCTPRGYAQWAARILEAIP